jgi:cytochrome c
MLQTCPAYSNQRTEKLNGRKFQKMNQWMARAATLLIILSAMLTILNPLPVAAASVAAGKAFAQANCSHCHSVDKFTPSTLAIAPPFRTLHERYPVESLEEALAEGIVTGHPSMPEFRLDPGQVSDFISFLKSMEK